MSTLKIRLQMASEATGINQAMLAERVGITVQAVSQWYTGQTKGWSMERLVTVANIFGVQTTWLASGEGEMFANDAQAHAHGLPEKWRAAGEVLILGAIKDRAGAFPAVVSMVMRVEDLQQRLQGYKPQGLMGIYTVEGSDMVPVLAPGELVLVDAGVRECVQEAVYLVEIDGALCVRRLTMVGQQLQVCCAAPGYPVCTVDQDGLLDGARPFRIRGRVLSAMGFRRI